MRSSVRYILKKNVFFESMNPVAHLLLHSLTEECYLLEQLNKIFPFVLIITVNVGKYKDNHERFCDGFVKFN